MPPLPAQRGVRHIARIAIASALAWWLGGLFGAPHPVFAVLAVILCLQDNAEGSVRTSAHRLVGVFGGVAIGLAALHGPGLSAPIAGLLVLASFLVGGWLRFGRQPNTQVAISALLLLAGGGGWAYGLQRLWQTALGGVVAVGAALALWPEHPLRALDTEARRLRILWAADVRDLAAGRRGGLAALRQQLHAHARRAQEAARGLNDLRGSLLWNPWRDESALGRLQARLGALDALYVHACSLVRALEDLQREHRAPPALGSVLADLSLASRAEIEPDLAERAGSALDRARAAVRALARQAAESVHAAAALAAVGGLEAELRAAMRTQDEMAAREQGSAPPRRIP